jgi:hypothetical protein
LGIAEPSAAGAADALAAGTGVDSAGGALSDGALVGALGAALGEPFVSTRVALDGSPATLLAAFCAAGHKILNPMSSDAVAAAASTNHLSAERRARTSGLVRDKGELVLEPESADTCDISAVPPRPSKLGLSAGVCVGA